MKYIEVTVTTTVDAEELVSDIFWDLTDYGVAISSVDDVLRLLNSDVIYDYYDKSITEGISGVSLVKGYFAVDDAENLLNILRRKLDELKANACIPLGTLETVRREVDGDDWITIWKKHFKPIKIGDITVCPEWIECNESGKVIKIDSNLAFGTGEHETTSMIAEKMQSFVKEGVNVLDVGTGSGILGLIAAELGATEVVMTDIDVVACKVAERNVLINGANKVCKILCQSNLNGIDGRFDVVVANITAEVLVVLARDISSKVKNSGRLVLSGILNDRVDKVENEFEKYGLKKIGYNTVGEWSCLTLAK